MRIRDSDGQSSVRSHRILFVLTWVAAAVTAALLAQAATFLVVAPITRDLAGSTPSGVALRLWFLVGRAVLPVFPAAAYGLTVAAFYRPRSGVRFGIATFAGLVVNLVVAPMIAPILIRPTQHGSLLGLLMLQAIDAWVVGTAQWLAVLRAGGDSRGLWVAAVVIATLAGAMMAVALPFPPPTLTRGGANFAFGWPGLVLSAAVTGTAFVTLFRLQRPSARGPKRRPAAGRAAGDPAAR